MSFLAWFESSNRLESHSTRRRPKPRGEHRRGARRLFLESLEDRRLLTFAPAVTYPVGMYPQAIVSADFNNDMVQDLAVANYSDSSVSVLLGDGTAGVGDGTFQSAVNSLTGSNPLSLAVGDFNGDGTLDLATANGGGDVSVLLGIEDGSGNGTGTFEAPTSIGSVSGPQSVSVGDFNGDGKMDLGVTSNNSVYDGQYCYSGSYGTYCYPHYHTESQANVLLGNGTGDFSAPNSTSLGYGYHTLAVAANLNGDIYDDFVTFNSDYYSVNVLLGDSGGYLQYYSDNYTGDYSYSVAAGDVNNDTFTDLVTANFYGNTVGVLLGDGLGSFSAAGNYSTGGYPTSVVLGDFTHDIDGNLDVAVTNYYTNQVGVLYGGGDGSFSTPALSAVGTNPFRVAAGDFNGDGWLDAATANSGLGNVSVLINDQDWPTPPPPPPPYVYIDDVYITEGNSGSTDATFTLSLSFAYATEITVHYETADISAADGSDYTAASGDVIFPAGETTMTVPIAVLGDRSAESTETFAVNLTTSDAFIGDGQGIGIILDDEPRVSINNMTVTEGNTGSVNATFTVTLSAMYDEDVIVPYATANDTATAGSDYTAAAATASVTIAAGTTSNTLTVLVTGDRVAEPTETYFVNLSAPVNASISDGQGLGAILDNEPRISINNVSNKEGNGNGKNTTSFVFMVTLSAAYDQNVTVSYATVVGGTATAGSDYQAKSTTLLTFLPGETTKTITILVYRDNTSESNETFFVDLSNPSSNTLINKTRGIGTILNDDR